MVALRRGLGAAHALDSRSPPLSYHGKLWYWWADPSPHTSQSLPPGLPRSTTPLYRLRVSMTVHNVQRVRLDPHTCTLGASKRAVLSAVSSPSPVIPGFAGTAWFTFRVLTSGLAAVALLGAQRRREPSNFERLSGRRNGGPRRRSDFGHHSFLCRRGPELELAAVLHGQGPHWLPPCGPTPASHPLRVAKRSPKTSFWVLLLAHDLLLPFLVSRRRAERFL